MDELRELYQEVIMDHNRNPRNFGEMEHADHAVEGRNPLCGDHYTIYLKMNGDRIEKVSFNGAGCAISKSSASIMSTILKGKTKAEAEKLFDVFHKIVTGELDAAAHMEELGKLAVFAGVAEFPVRVKCATLPWHAMHSALAGSENTVSTEEEN